MLEWRNYKLAEIYMADETVAGHTYELNNSDGTRQTLQFVRKEAQEDGTLKTVDEGTTTEAVIEVLIDRLEKLNVALPDEFTQAAISNLNATLEALNMRTAKRQATGVEGTNKPIPETKEDTIAA